MTVNNDKDFDGLMRIGRIVGMTIKVMAEAMRPGMTTAELDAVGAAYLKAQGAQSAPQLVYKFPGATCISINEEVAHGIPGGRVIQTGDLVNIDVSAELGGYYADSGGTYPVPPIKPEYQKICDCARAALQRSIEAARAGQRINAVGKAVELQARACSLNVIRELSGHGVGRSIHEKPSIPNYFTKRADERLTDGLVITLEPFITNGMGRVYTADDGWTIKTPEGTRTAQYEHTIIVRHGAPVLVTAV
jgi:methionyl aminopeptidase